MHVRLSSLAIVLILLAVAGVGCTAGSPTPVPTQAPVPTPTAMAAAPAQAPTTAPAAPVVLKLEGPAGTRSLTLADLRALPAVEGWGGIKSSTGRITIPAPFKGVAVTELAKLAGGMTAETGANLLAKDGYAMTMSYDQVTGGDFIAYDPATGDELKRHDPLTAILAYEMSGKALDETSDGTLRLMVISTKNNQVVDGHWSVKWVTQLSFKSLGSEWNLSLSGKVSEEMDRGTFQSCSAASCHGRTWTDDKAQVWTGVPLYYLAGRIDDEIKHGDDSYNHKAADEGYSIQITASDGFSVTIDGARARQDKKLMVAYLINNNPLEDKYFPLRLVGPGLKGSEMVGKIARISLSGMKTVPPSATATPAPKPTETPKPASAAPTVAAGVAALTITGLVDSAQSLTMDALKAMQIVKMSAVHPKKGPQDYEGVRMNTLIDLAKPKATATKVVLTSGDGYVTELTLSQVRACPNSLLAFNAGKLDAVFPELESSFWAKDVVKAEIR